MVKFRVKFLHLAEQTKTEFDYDNLFDAIKVCKETNIGHNRIHREAMTNEQFDSQLLTLLTTGFIYTGDKLNEYADGDIMIMLLQVEERTGIERPVYPNVVPVPFQTNREGITSLIPHQNH